MQKQTTLKALTLATAFGFTVAGGVAWAEGPALGEAALSAAQDAGDAIMDTAGKAKSMAAEAMGLEEPAAEDETAAGLGEQAVEDETAAEQADQAAEAEMTEKVEAMEEDAAEENEAEVSGDTQ